MLPRVAWVLFAVCFAPGAALADEREDEVRTPPRPAPPRGVACVVYGRGTDADGSCSEPRLTEVSHGRDGARPLARFRPYDVDVAWGIYPGRGRGWVHVEDGTFVLDGFADLAGETFVLRREVEVVEEHVWLKHGIDVHVIGADRDGVAVAVEDMVDGINALPPRVPCEALLFEPAPEPPAPDPAEAPVVEPEHSTPRSSTLSLHTAPGGPRLTKLQTPEPQLPLLLDVVERKDDWTRVRFETDRARFDVWSPTSEIDAQSGSMLGLSGIGCGGIGIGATPNPARVKSKTAVVIGTLPIAAASSGLTLVEGAAVHVVSRRGHFVEIEPAYSSIVPPEGKKFWIKANALDADLGAAGVR